MTFPPPTHRAALFLRMAELLSTLDLYTFLHPEEAELAVAAKGWDEIKHAVAEEVGVIRTEGA